MHVLHECGDPPAPSKPSRTTLPTLAKCSARSHKRSQSHLRTRALATPLRVEPACARRCPGGGCSMPTGSEQGGDAQTLAAALPPLRLPPPDAPLLPAVTAGSRSPHLDSAGPRPLAEASLLSPMASGAVGRSFSCKASPEWRVELLRGAEAESGGGWGAVAREARSCPAWPYPSASPTSPVSPSDWSPSGALGACCGLSCCGLGCLPAAGALPLQPAPPAPSLPAAWWGAWAPLS